MVEGGITLVANTPEHRNEAVPGVKSIRGWLDNLPIHLKNATVDFESRAGIGGGMPGRIPHGYRPMDWYLPPPFFLPPLIGHAQKQILTYYSSAHGTCAAQRFGFSQPGGKRTAARRTHALWSVG